MGGMGLQAGGYPGFIWDGTHGFPKNFFKKYAGQIIWLIGNGVALGGLLLLNSAAGISDRA